MSSEFTENLNRYRLLSYQLTRLTFGDWEHSLERFGVPKGLILPVNLRFVKKSIESRTRMESYI